MTESHRPNDLTIYPVSKQTSSPDPGLMLSAVTDLVQEYRIQFHTLCMEKHHLQNQVNDLSQQNLALSKRNKALLRENIILNKSKNDLEERLADANNENEFLTRSLAYAKTEILHLRSSQHPESQDGEFYDDWHNHRYEDE